MNNPKVTVIIPVYNTEKYVAETVRTITGQTLRELEILLINDGSTDGSLAVLEKLAAEDDRITLYSQPNQGLSVSRNAGIDRAQGKYLYFMDSDDLLEADAMECCYARAEAEQLDFVLFDAVSFGPGASAPWFNYRRVEHIGEAVRPGVEQLRRMYEGNCYRAAAWLSFIRTSFLRELGLYFYKGILHEDELFTPSLYLAAARTAGINRTFFHRRMREESIMGSGFTVRHMQGYEVVLRELSRIAEEGDPANRKLLKSIIDLMFKGILDKADILPWRWRWRLAVAALWRHPRSLRPKTLVALLLKKPLNKLRGR